MVRLVSPSLYAIVATIAIVVVSLPVSDAATCSLGAYNHTIKMGSLTFSYDIDNENGKITAGVKGAATGWIGWGVGNRMSGSEAIIGVVSPSNTVKAYSMASELPETFTDISSAIGLSDASVCSDGAGNIILTFTRKLDGVQKNIPASGNVNLIGAWSDNGMIIGSNGLPDPGTSTHKGNTQGTFNLQTASASIITLINTFALFAFVAIIALLA